jgi:hypothetical protein
MTLEDEKYFASLVGVWCRVEVTTGKNEFIHSFPTNKDDVSLSILTGEYRPGLFTCWMAMAYPDRIKITPLEPIKG